MEQSKESIPEILNQRRIKNKMTKYICDECNKKDIKEKDIMTVCKDCFNKIQKEEVVEEKPVEEPVKKTEEETIEETKLVMSKEDWDKIEQTKKIKQLEEKLRQLKEEDYKDLS